MTMIQETTIGAFPGRRRAGPMALFDGWMERRRQKARLAELRRTVETLREISPHLLSDIGLGCSDDVALQGRMDQIDVRF